MRAAAGDLGPIVGSDPRMIRVFEIIRAVSPGRTTVLMSGESGTGKSMIAHAIHSLSTRRDKPYVELSCGSIPETLLESELFGHVKGAFTGAHADKAGRFLAANGGTIFLDEINSASPGMQLKLLRVLQERKFEPVGSTQTIEVDVRVVLASNQPLETLVATGQFRQDLYYRINVVKIELPPLGLRPLLSPPRVKVPEPCLRTSLPPVPLSWPEAVTVWTMSCRLATAVWYCGSASFLKIRGRPNQTPAATRAIPVNQGMKGNLTAFMGPLCELVPLPEPRSPDRVA
jgi:hypothetical protein